MNNHQKIKRLTLTAILASLVVVFAFLPIKVFLEITLTIVPIVVGVIYGGPIMGLVLGTIFGLVSFIQCLGYSPFGTMIFSFNPFLTFLVCVPTRMLAGFIPGLIAHVFEKKENFKKIKNIIVGLLMPLLNTIFFMIMLVICFYDYPEVKNLIPTTNPIMFMILFAGWNAVIELGLGLLTGLSMVKVIDSVKK